MLSARQRDQCDLFIDLYADKIMNFMNYIFPTKKTLTPKDHNATRRGQTG